MNTLTGTKNIEIISRNSTISLSLKDTKEKGGKEGIEENGFHL